MKGAIIGSTCSGKTTGIAYLITQLEGLRKKVGIGNEVAVDCPYPLNENGGFLTQWWILSRQIERESKLQSWFPNVIMDRSVLDSIAYAKVSLNNNKISLNDFEQIRNTALSWMKLNPYDFFIYLTPLENCQLSKHARDFQMDIENSFQEIISSIINEKILIDLNIYTFTYQDKMERNNAILKTIKEVMKL